MIKLIYYVADTDSVEAEAGAVTTEPESTSNRKESPIIEEKSTEREASYNSTGMN